MKGSIACSSRRIAGLMFAGASMWYLLLGTASLGGQGFALLWECFDIQGNGFCDQGVLGPSISFTEPPEDGLGRCIDIGVGSHHFLDPLRPAMSCAIATRKSVQVAPGMCRLWIGKVAGVSIFSAVRRV